MEKVNDYYVVPLKGFHALHEGMSNTKTYARNIATLLANRKGDICLVVKVLAVVMPDHPAPELRVQPTEADKPLSVDGTDEKSDPLWENVRWLYSGTLTHTYKGRPVKLLELTYISNGQQYCTIEMINRMGKVQRQTVQVRHLTPYPSASAG